MNYTVYCDESRHTGGADCKYSVIGGLWVARNRRDAISKELRDLKSKNEISAELKWSKVSRLKLEPYKRVVDYYWGCPDLHYRAIIIDQDAVDYESFHDGDVELGFYKFYYEMLEKWLLAGNDYNILLDFKNNSDTSRLPVLRRVLENYCDPRGVFGQQFNQHRFKGSPTYPRYVISSLGLYRRMLTAFRLAHLNTI